MPNNGCFWTMSGVAENKCSRNQRFITEVTAKALRNECSGKKV